MTEEGDNGAQQEEENATTTFVELSRVGPGDTGSGTGVIFFNTNSTGQLAFLDNMLAIYQHEMYPGVDTIREWEWKGGTLPFETGGAGARILQGVAVALVPVSVRIARDLFPPAKFPYAQGMILSMYQGGSAVGLVLGAAVVYFVGWQGVFLSAIPFALLFLFLLWKFIPKVVEEKVVKDSSPKHFSKIIDIPGLITLILTTSTFMLSFTFLGGGTDQSIALFWIFFAIGIVSLVAFLCY